MADKEKTDATKHDQYDEMADTDQPENTTGEEMEGVAAAEQKAEDYLARLQRTQADFVNYKRRVEQERSEFIRQASAETILAILPVLDDLDRAIESVPGDIKKHSWVDGIRHISRKLHTALESRGLKRIESVGKAFDPNFHESAALAPGKEDMVVEEIKPGYCLYDRVIRPCTVLVGSGREAAFPENSSGKKS